MEMNGSIAVFPILMTNADPWQGTLLTPFRSIKNVCFKIISLITSLHRRNNQPFTWPGHPYFGDYMSNNVRYLGPYAAQYCKRVTEIHIVLYTIIHVALLWV